MSRPIDLVLARLDNPRPSGRNRWRCVCPSCGGNKSALSVGIGDDDAVLLRCWKGCDAAAVVGSLGLQLHELFPPKLSGHGSAPMRRRGMLTAGQAMEVTAFECLLVWTAASNLANGHALTNDDRDRLGVAAQRIQSLAAEVRA